jgi:hypothetical protein
MVVAMARDSSVAPVFQTARLICALAGGVVCLAHSGNPAQASTRSRSISKIILLSIDALRAHRLACYGYHKANTSPTIDAWADGALVFDHKVAATIDPATRETLHALGYDR